MGAMTDNQRSETTVRVLKPFADLRDMDFSNANLSGANCRGANCRDANFGGANLGYANLGYAKLNGAYFTGANCRDANCRGANFHGANCRGADFHGADFSGAKLTGADFHGADFSGAKLTGAIGIIQGPQDRRGYDFYAFRHNDATQIKAGCRWLTLPEARQHWTHAHADDPSLRAECLAILDSLEAIARARGWTLE